jgi:hypothetical protein
MEDGSDGLLKTTSGFPPWLLHPASTTLTAIKTKEKTHMYAAKADRFFA